MLYASSILRLSFCVGDPGIWREDPSFQPCFGQPYSLECPIESINIIMWCLLYTGYRGGLRKYLICKVRPFVPSSSIYTYLCKYKYHQTTKLLYHRLVFKARSTRVGHVHRPISAAGHALSHNPLKNGLADNGTLYIRHFRSWRRCISYC